ncbi:Na+/H+ antiporter [Planosporangium thailandense]|uniref:Na+/H+ antiporter n=1 Tax=Planosporangium thailandense TaxID=765197 RepID=A0ABX0Y1Z8_9ACTN|nr:cation:proton antiporter [Planosporangium thailandense]NJC71605.1 Na+/H+ antiporter [Planosporangium thailandense]
MLGLELIVVLGVAVLLCGIAARRLGIPAPVFLLLIGVLLGFVPALRDVGLPPVVVLLLFLPALLYWESLTTSLREIRNNLGPIVLASTGLVILTAAAVAVVGHGLGLPWGCAWVLGAAIAPTDAAAVAVLARALPRRLVTVLRTESLVNDGTALVIYGIAVGVTVGEEQLNPARVSWLLALSYVGGVAAGLVTAWLSLRIRRVLDDPLLENVVSLLTPFTAFLLAELIRASGVLAVVACGLTMSQVAPRAIRADTRTQSVAFWSLSTYALNGALFVLVGLQLPEAVKELTSVGLYRGIAAVGIISAVIIGIRFLWLFAMPDPGALLRRLAQSRLLQPSPRPYAIGTASGFHTMVSLAASVVGSERRHLGRMVRWAARQRPPRISRRARVVAAVSGVRGAVSLAAALAVPRHLNWGAPFPGRDMIVFVTAGVIVVTLVLQGLALPYVVRWTRLPADTTIEQERHLAETVATERALAAMDEIADVRGVDPMVVERMRIEYEKHLRVLRAHGDEADPNPGRRAECDFRSLRLGLLRHKRETVAQLRDEQLIDDAALRQIQAQLDAEEVRLSRRDLPD